MYDINNPIGVYNQGTSTKVGDIRIIDPPTNNEIIFSILGGMLLIVLTVVITLKIIKS